MPTAMRRRRAEVCVDDLMRQKLAASRRMVIDDFVHENAFRSATGQA